MPEPADTPVHGPEKPGFEPLSRNVKVLGLVSLAQDAGSEMMYPLLPRFITGTLGAPVVALGAAEGLADAVAAAMKLVAGRLADGRRRPWIAAGYAIATFGKIIVAAATVWPMVIVGRAVDRVGKGIRGVPRDALIADETNPGNRGRAFGYHRSLDTIGAVIGPLLALLLLRVLDGRIRIAVALAVIPAAISVGLVAFVRERARPASHAAAARTAGQRPTLPAGVKRLLVPMVVFGLVNSTDALLLQHAGDVGLSTTQVVLVYAMFNAVYASLGYPVGKWVDRVPHKVPFALGLALFAIAYIGLGMSHSAVAVWVLMPLYGCFPAMTDGVARAWLSDLSTPQTRTWVLGVHGAATGAAILGAGIWSGLAWGHAGRLPLVISGVIAAAVAVWIALMPNAPTGAAAA